MAFVNSLQFKGYLRRKPRTFIMSMLNGFGYNNKWIRENASQKAKMVEIVAELWEQDSEKVTSYLNAMERGKPMGNGEINIDEIATKVAEKLGHSGQQQMPEELIERVDKAIADAYNAVNQKLDQLKDFEDKEKIIAGLTDDIKSDVVKRLRSYQRVEVSMPRTRVQIKDAVLPEEFTRMIQLASQRVNIMLVGPSGCGKTYVCEHLAKAMRARTFGYISCSMGMSESQLSGWLLPVGTGGKFEYVASPFIDIYENGGLFVFDEIDAADPNVLVFLNTALAGEQFFLPQRYKNPMVKRHKNFMCIAAANTFGHGADAMYVGRNQLDAATLDRFRVGMIMMDYSEAVERSISEPAVYDWAVRIRRAIRKHGLRRVMSTRTIKEMTKMVRAYDWTADDMDQAYFADWTQDEYRRIQADVEVR